MNIKTKTIIWIDEDSDRLYSVVEPLEWAGHRIIRLRTPREARSQVELIRHADLLLLEILLSDSRPGHPSAGGYPGLALLEELRDEHGVQTPAIVLTIVLQDDIPARLAAPHLRVLAVVRKPVLPSELKACVERAFPSPAA